MELEEAKKYIIMILRQKDVPDAVKSQECIYAVEAIETVLNYLERYKRLAVANLKNSEEFQDNICKHRCILKSQLQELEENSIPKKKIENEIEMLKAQCGGNVFHIQQTLNAEIKLLEKLLEE